MATKERVFFYHSVLHATLAASGAIQSKKSTDGNVQQQLVQA